MRKTLKLTTMLLCIAAIATLSSCTKEKFDANELIGTTWKCTYNCKWSKWEENAYVGTIWTLSSEKVPYTPNEYYLYKDGELWGNYFVESTDAIRIFSDFEPNHGSDAYLNAAHYFVEKNNNELVLSAYVTNYDGSRSLQVFLKFVQQ